MYSCSIHLLTFNPLHHFLSYYFSTRLSISQPCYYSFSHFYILLPSSVLYFIFSNLYILLSSQLIIPRYFLFNLFIIATIWIKIDEPNPNKDGLISKLSKHLYHNN